MRNQTIICPRVAQWVIYAACRFIHSCHAASSAAGAVRHRRLRLRLHPGLGGQKLPGGNERGGVPVCPTTDGCFECIALLGLIARFGCTCCLSCNSCIQSWVDNNFPRGNERGCLPARCVACAIMNQRIHTASIPSNHCCVGCSRILCVQGHPVVPTVAAAVQVGCYI